MMNTKIRPRRLLTAALVAAAMAGLVGGGARATDDHGDHHEHGDQVQDADGIEHGGRTMGSTAILTRARMPRPSAWPTSNGAG